MSFREVKLALCTADLAGYARATADLEPLAVAAFLDGWYRTLEDVLGARGGRVVKYMGDGCLAVFPPDACAAAVDAALELVRRGPRTAGGRAVEVGVRIHLGVVAEGEVGPDRRYDIFGSAVNDLFRMGGAGAVLISEPVYQALPDGRRAPWQPRPSGVYALTAEAAAAEEEPPG
jgi:class 3 adenylate cyclase